MDMQWSYYVNYTKINVNVLNSLGNFYGLIQKMQWPYGGNNMKIQRKHNGGTCGNTMELTWEYY